MNRIPYEERAKTYINAMIAYGEEVQIIKALEELAECQQAICKAIMGGDQEHLAEEIADATIMLEQMRIIFPINERVCEYMDAKVQRLDDRLKGKVGENGKVRNGKNPVAGSVQICYGER
jgi:phosphotransacetylase